MDIMILRDILRGGLEKLKEAEVVLVGGHSVDDPELKYGLSVTGLIHPAKVARNIGAKPGDSLILTKPLGTGIINTAIKAGMADEASVAAVTAQMAALNRKASEIMQEIGVNACTDVTGFGFLGHACEMIQNSRIGFEIDHRAVPVIPGTSDFAAMGLIPAGAYRNRDFRAAMVEFAAGVPLWASDILFDPQTSGGLLISVADEKANELVERIRNAGFAQTAIIGKAALNLPGKIRVR